MSKSYEDGDFSERIRRSNEDRARKKVIKHRERHIAKPVAVKPSGEFFKARVISSEGANVMILDRSGSRHLAKPVKSTVSGNENASLVAVGDEVLAEPSENHIAVIREVFPRRTKLSRKAHKRRDSFEQVIAANIDILAIVMSAGDPPFQNGILDTYIIAGLEGKLEILIVLNKIDELGDNPRRYFIEEVLSYYKKIGYEIIRVSAKENAGTHELKNFFRNKTAVFAGKSGVGKSSLINALVGKELLRTKELTRKEQRGAHTTTNAALIPLDEDGNSFIADTPGIREFFHFDLDPDLIKFYFPDFTAIQDRCELPNCMHIHEPGCAVMEAVDNDRIPEWRYNSYMGLWELAENERRKSAAGS